MNIFGAVFLTVLAFGVLYINKLDAEQSIKERKMYILPQEERHVLTDKEREAIAKELKGFKL